MARSGGFDAAQPHVTNTKFSSQQRIYIGTFDDDISSCLIPLERHQSASGQFFVRRFDRFALDDRHVADHLALGLRIRALTRGVPVSVQAAPRQSPHLGASFHGLTDARGDEQTHDAAHITRPRLLSGL